MSRFQITREDECIELAMPFDSGHVVRGGILFLVSVGCNLVLAILALTQEPAAPGASPSGSGPLGILQPQAHPFGFLWVLSTVVLVILIPIYVLRIRRSGITYRFDRAAGRLTMNGRELAPLRLVERVRLRTMTDPDGAHWYRLTVDYADGHEIFIDDSYDADELTALALDLADYTGRPLVRRGGRDETT
jgi:hypothetical protein